MRNMLSFPPTIVIQMYM